MKLIFFLPFFPLFLFGQEIDNENNLSIKTFYTKLYKEFEIIKKDSTFLLNRDCSSQEFIKNHRNLYESEQVFSFIYLFPDSNFKILTQNISLDKLNDSIDKALTYNVGELFSNYTILNISPKYSLIFELAYVSLDCVYRIYSANGKLLMTDPESNETLSLLLWPGHISNQIKETNIYKSPSSKSVIIGTFKENEIFFYLPNKLGKWVKVSKKDDSRNLKGYIQKDKIAPLNKMPKHLFKKLQKIRDQC